MKRSDGAATARAMEVAEALLARYSPTQSPIGSEKGADFSEATKQTKTESRQDDGASPPVDYLRMLRFLTWYDGFLRAHRIAGRVFAEEGTGALKEDSDQLSPVLAGAHRILLEHPVASRAAWSALCAEGRRYATTPEGAALADSLRRAPRVRRLAFVFRSLTMGMLTDGEEGELPSTYLDNLLRAADSDDLEVVLGGLLGKVGGGA